jgi:DNA-binding CsgD family transcriptional regulator
MDDRHLIDTLERKLRPNLSAFGLIFPQQGAPDARLVPLESRNAVPLPSDPAFATAVAAIREFLLEGDRRGPRTRFGSDRTAREREVLELIAQGLDDLQIAAHLGLSEKTVRNHITPIFDKLGVENRSQTIVKAREAGLGNAKPPS